MSQSCFNVCIFHFGNSKYTQLESVELRGAEANSKGSKNVDMSAVTKVLSGVAQCLGYNPPTNNNNETITDIPRQVEVKISNILSIEINSVALNKLQLEALNLGLDGNRLGMIVVFD